MTRTVQRGFWMCVDGIEGSGKSTLVRNLANHYPGSVVAPEFSSSLTGRALAEAVLAAPHVINQSRFGQSLAFIGDFHETYEAFVRPNVDAGATVVSDRGWLSKYAYQAQVLDGVLDPVELDGLLTRLLQLPRMPDLTIHLTCDLNTVRRRLIARDGSCDDARERFIVGAANKYVHLITNIGEHRNAQHPIVSIDSADRDWALQQAVSAIADRGLTTHLDTHSRDSS